MAEAQQGDRMWRTSWDGVRTSRWYFVELSWDLRGGLNVYVDLDLVDADSSPVTQQRQQVDVVDGDRAYLGSATIDDLEFWFGERSKLIELDFITRGNSSRCSPAVTKRDHWRI